MPDASSRWNWVPWRWLKGDVWLRILALAQLMLLILLITWIFAPFQPPGGIWSAGLLWLLFFVALNVVIYRRGGWGLLGPHFYYDVVRLARRGRSTALRVAYILALFAGLAIVFTSTPFRHALRPNDFARVSLNFAYALFLIQNIAVLVLTPAYLGSAIAEERERRTLELLFTTHLSNTEIVLGKLTSRLIHLVGFVLAGMPILGLVQFWGGVDFVLIAGNLLNTLLNILSVGSICLLASVLARTVAGAVMTSYAVIAPLGFCCGVFLNGFPFVLQDERTGAGPFTVQNVGILCIVHFAVVVGFLSLAVAALREIEPLGVNEVGHEFRGAAQQTGPELLDAVRALTQPPSGPLTVTSAIQARLPHPEPILEPPRTHRVVEPENEFSMPYTLPPVTDDALMWKERYVGGPPWFFSPVVLVPALPFLATGIFVLGFWFVRSLFLNHDELRHAVAAWAIVLRVLYYGCLAAYVLGVGFRAASSVARERQQQTLDALLLLPIDRSELLRAKLLGSLWRGWPWLALLAGNIVLGTLLGAYHPFSAVMLCLAPWALIFFIAGLGLMLSVQMTTVLRANLFLLVVVILLTASTFVLPIGFSPLTYLEPLAFPMWYDVGNERAMFERRFIERDGLYAGLASAILLVFDLVGAAIFLKIAFTQFENRTHQADS